MDELYHYGVQGMKWGVRRRSGSTSVSARNKAKTKGWSKDAKQAYRIKKKKINQMSNAELKQLTERKKIEQNYKKVNPSVINRGMRVALGTAAAMGTVLAIHDNGGRIISIGQSFLSRFK